jgi:GDPmannose 4,6-dehydratase
MPTNGYNEESVFHPRSPYGVAKIYGYWAVKNYREAYNLFACNGILFNHESPRRGGTFVTKKVINNMVEIKQGKREVLHIGNLDSKRDWGYAKDYVEGMWLMLQRDTPEDFVLATNETHSVRELIEITAELIGYKINWVGSGLEEKGYDEITGKLLVEIDAKYFRPSEVELLLGDASKAKSALGWEPKVKFKELVQIMVDHEMS